MLPGAWGYGYKKGLLFMLRLARSRHRTDPYISAIYSCFFKLSIAKFQRAILSRPERFFSYSSVICELEFVQYQRGKTEDKKEPAHVGDGC